MRQATVGDLPKLQAIALEFAASSKFIRGFEPSRFIALWTGLLESGTGVIFLLEKGGEVIGMLGGVAYPEPYSGSLIATEFFWFVSPESRGGGIALYKAFERWARERDCSEIRMVHLLDSMPAKLEKVYKHLGFTPAEVHYTKEL